MFVKRYNLAYDAFLIRFFNQGGIKFDEKTTYEEVAPRWNLLSRRDDMTTAEKLLCDYVSNWGSHPEARPTYYELFDKAIGGDGWPDLKKLRELESQIVQADGRFIFSRDEVASIISKFYSRYLRDPLRAELEEGHGGKDLLRFFSMKEIQVLPIRLTATQDEDESLRNKVAGELLLWLDSVTPEKIDLDIQRVLEEHERMGEHMKAFDSFTRPIEKEWSCAHESEYVALDSYRGATGKRLSTYLNPARGSDASDHVIEMGWQIVTFPNFLVVVRE